MVDTILGAQTQFVAGRRASDLLQASLSAIDADNARTNAFIRVTADSARLAAVAADRRLIARLAIGPLDGIPMSIKDLFDVAGQVTTAASHVLDDRVATTTATAVSRLIDAGAVIIGRTNLHEFALGTTSEESAFGPVRHPLDSTRSAGGSSGGSAVAVQSGMGLASLGTDTGGSIRIPAAICGVVGLKPSYCEVPTDGVIPLSPSLDHVGPIARTVQDAAIVFWSLVGGGRLPVAGGARTVRLARLGEYFAAPLDPVVATAFDRAVATLGHQGIGLDASEIAGCDTIADTYTTIVLWEAARWHRPYLDAHPERYTPTTVRSRLETGRTIPDDAYRRARAACDTLRRAVDAAFGGADALLLPTLPIVAPLLGTDTIAIGRERPITMPLRTAMLKHTQLFNMTGHPAISIPIPSPGLPVGLQLVGRIGQTSRLLDVAEQCEACFRGNAL